MILKYSGRNMIHYIGALPDSGWVTCGLRSLSHFQGQKPIFGATAGLILMLAPPGNLQSTCYTLLFSLEQPLLSSFSVYYVALLFPWSVNYASHMHTRLVIHHQNLPFVSFLGNSNWKKWKREAVVYSQASLTITSQDILHNRQPPSPL